MAIHFRRSAIIAAFFFLIYLLFYRVMIVYDYSENIAGLEHTFIYATQLIMMRGSMYSDPEVHPYSLYQYTPLYFETVAAIANDVKDPRQIYIIGRWLNFIANVLSGLFVFFICFKGFKISRTAAIIAGIMSFSLYFAHSYAFRPDGAKTMFSLLSLLLIILNIEKVNRLQLLLAGLACTISFYFKQDGCLVGLMALIILGWHKNYKAILFFCVGSFSSLVAFSAFYLIRSGEDFYLNMAKGLQQGANFEWLSFLVKYYHCDLYILIIMMLGIWLGLRKAKPGKLEWSVLAVSVLYQAFGWLSAFKWGSTFAYLTEAFVLNCALFFVVIDKIELSEKNKSRLLLFGSMIFVVNGLISLDNHTWHRYWPKKSQRELNKERYERKAYAAKMFESKWLKEGDYYLCFDKGFNTFLPEHIVFSTYEVEYPNYMACNFNFHTLPNQIFDYSNLDDDIDQGKINYLISRDCNKIEKMFQPAELGYKKVDQIENYVVYQYSN